MPFVSYPRLYVSTIVKALGGSQADVDHCDVRLNKEVPSEFKLENIELNVSNDRIHISVNAVNPENERNCRFTFDFGRRFLSDSVGFGKLLWNLFASRFTYDFKVLRRMRSARDNEIVAGEVDQERAIATIDTIKNLSQFNIVLGTNRLAAGHNIDLLVM